MINVISPYTLIQYNYVSEVLWKSHGNLTGKVKADVYSLSGLGQMYGVW